MWIQFDAVSAPASFLGGEQGGSAAGECIQDDAAPFRAIQDGVADKCEWFRCRVPGKRGIPILSETAHAGILPNIGSASSEAPEFNIVDVPGAAILVNENKFVGGPI